MFVEVRPTAQSATLQPDPKRPPSFDFITDVPAYVVLELANDPSLFEDTDPANRKTGAYARVASDGAPGAPVGAIQTKRTSQNDPTAGYTYQLATDTWQEMLDNNRIYYRASAAVDAQMTNPVASYLRPPAMQPVDDQTVSNFFAWAPFIEILRDQIIYFYHRRPEQTPRQRDKTPWLAVSKNTVVPGKKDNPLEPDTSASTVKLRGINVTGLQYRKPSDSKPAKTADDQYCPAANFRESAGISRTRLEQISKWGANVIRLTINQQWAVVGLDEGDSVADAARQQYLTDIDAIVDMCASLGIYVMLALQQLDDRPGRRGTDDPARVQVQPSVPNNLSIVLWAMLAARYQDEPAVLYDLCNEPHPPETKEKPWYIGREVDRDGWPAYWKEWARVLEQVIHAIQPKAIIVVSGVNGPVYSADLTAMPLVEPTPPGPPDSSASAKPTPLPNIVYSAHFYPDVGTDTGTWNKLLGGVPGAGSSLRDVAPVFMGEWGPKESESEDASQTWSKAFSEYLGSYLKAGGDAQGLLGWTAWSWADEPFMVKDRLGVSVPPKDCTHFDDLEQKPVLTKWGAVATQALKG